LTRDSREDELPTVEEMSSEVCCVVLVVVLVVVFVVVLVVIVVVTLVVVLGVSLLCSLGSDLRIFGLARRLRENSSNGLR